MTEKEEWFKEQCKQKGLSTEEITVFGGDSLTDLDRYYATNRDGDFLYVLKHEDGSFTMEYVIAIDMVVESIYPELLLGLVQSMPDSYDPDPEIHVSRWALDKVAIVQCFRECISRNVEFSESYRKQLLLKPAMGVFLPHKKVETFNQVVPGMWDSTEIISGEFIPKYVVQPRMLLQTEGYRFAVKLIDVERFISIYGLIQEEGQYGPFRVLAELEEVVLRTWKEEGKIRSYVWLSNFEERYRTPSRLYWLPFFFSHFEVEREPNADYRTIFLVYMNEYHEFEEW